MYPEEIKYKNFALIESSFKESSCGFILDGKSIFSYPEKADWLMYDMKKLAIEHSFDMKKLDYVGISIGPGSFTGLRVGLAAAKGICLASGAELITVSTLEVVARMVQSADYNGVVMPLISANSKTGEYYYAEFTKEGNKYTRLTENKAGLISELNFEGKLIVSRDKIENIDYDNVSEKMTGTALAGAVYEAAERGEITDYITAEPDYVKDLYFKTHDSSKI